MRRIALALIILCSLATFFALTYGGCEPIVVVPVPTIDVTQAPYFADNTGAVDASTAIQAAINAAVPGDTVYVPAGVYIVRYNAQGYGSSLYINTRSNITFQMATGAEIKLIPCSAGIYHILHISNSTGITVTGGTFTGDYTLGHTGTTGEQGYGISTWNSKNITVNGVTCQRCWGDGITIDGDSALASGPATIMNCTCTYNRRGGLSIQDGHDVHVTGNTFTYNTGANPKFGMDLEPYQNGQGVDDVTITGNTMSHNYGGGFVAGGYANQPVTNATITGNTFESNTLHAIWMSNCQGLAYSGNTYSGNGGPQIEIAGDTSIPLITETIAGFIHPGGKVNTASTVVDGSRVWTVGLDGKTWR